MTIADIVRTKKGRAGSNGSWRVERLDSDPFRGQEFALIHYSTTMLVWRQSTRHGVELIDASTGYGSVSDQGGVNQAFCQLGLPYRFQRDRRGGGPRIENTEQRLADAGYRCVPGGYEPIARAVA